METIEILKAFVTVKEAAATLTKNPDVVDVLDNADLALALHYTSILKTRLQDILKSSNYVSPRARLFRARKGRREMEREM